MQKGNQQIKKKIRQNFVSMLGVIFYEFGSKDID